MIRRNKMQKYLLILITTLIVINGVTFGQEKQTKKAKTILIIAGDVPSVPAYEPILEGIRKKLQEAYGDPFNLHIEFLGIEKYDGGVYLKKSFDLLNEKYRDIKPDLLICIETQAIITLKDYWNHISQ